MSNREHAWTRYCQLMNERPELFKKSEYLKIETDRAIVDDFIKSKNRTIGVVYESPYSMMVVDLVSDISGNYFAYERLVPTNKGAVVCVPIYNGQFILLRQYRHALRDFQLGFPRGFGEVGLSSSRNLQKELKEEIGSDVISFEHIGRIAPDSGITSGVVDVYRCNVTEPSIVAGYEGIERLCLLEEAALNNMIALGKITDAFTLSAYMLHCSKV